MVLQFLLTKIAALARGVCDYKTEFHLAVSDRPEVASHETAIVWIIEFLPKDTRYLSS